MAKMRAVRLHGVPNDTRLDCIDAPEPTTDSVIVRLTAATICANDIKEVVRGSRLSLPAPLGHELAGVIEEVGDQVRGHTVGQRVCLRFASAIYCGHCFYCLRGWHNLCDAWQTFDDPAGWVEYMRFSSRLDERLLRLPDNVDFEMAALVEPLACALAGVEQADIQPGEEVVILGAGAMGLFSLQLALLAGAARAYVVDTVPFRLRVARELGADEVIDFKTNDPVDAVRDLTHGRGAAAVIECSGTLQGAAQAVNMSRKRGAVVWFAGFPRPSEVTLDANYVHYSGLRLTGSTGSTIRHAHKILNYLAAGRLEVAPIITHHFKLEDARAALALGASQGDSLKIVLEP